jgi:GH25 family lysozyme M1 (1,4-beta-N-acetylmuramidase)
MATFGPDVSDWQESVDWNAVRAAGATFGLCKSSEGVSIPMKTFEANRRGMADAGMAAIGIYHFAKPGQNGPFAEADFFCDTIGSLRDREFTVLDIEHGDQSIWPDFIVAFCERVEARLGRGPVIYMSESAAQTMPDQCARWPLWDAGYVRNFPAVWTDLAVGPWPRILMWQFTDQYDLPGISGTCDMNIAPDDLVHRLAGNLAGSDQEDPFMALTDVEMRDMLGTLKAISSTTDRDVVGTLGALRNTQDRIENLLTEMVGLLKVR